MKKAMVVFVTAPTLKEARSLTRRLVREKRVACVNIVPRIESVYWWKGNIERAGESLLLMKTSPAKVKGLIRRVRELHTYTVPEVLACPVQDGNPAYLAWLLESVR